MADTFQINLNWKKLGDFNKETFNRDHTITFSGQQKINSSAAVQYSGNANTANPEELLVSALASCHMLTFLVIAAKSGFVVESYNDIPTATLDKNEDGKLAITLIDLYPVVEFKSEHSPTPEQLKSFHEKAHRNCFIANSVKSKVNIHSEGRSS